MRETPLPGSPPVGRLFCYFINHTDLRTVGTQVMRGPTDKLATHVHLMRGRGLIVTIAQLNKVVKPPDPTTSYVE